jgi:hypothetical protein
MKKNFFTAKMKPKKITGERNENGSESRRWIYFQSGMRRP